MELVPAGLRDEDGVPVVPLDLRNRHVASLLVSFDVEIEVLVLDPQILVVWRSAIIHLLLKGFVSIVIFLDKFIQILLDFSHSICRNKYLVSRRSSRTSVEGLGNLQKPASCILLEIHVILFVPLIHHLGLQFSLFQVVRVKLMKTIIEINHLDKILTKHVGSSKCHQNLILSSIRGHLGNLEESSSLILVDIQIESLGVQEDGSRGKVLSIRRHLSLSHNLQIFSCRSESSNISLV